MLYLSLCNLSAIAAIVEIGSHVRPNWQNMSPEAAKGYDWPICQTGHGM